MSAEPKPSDVHAAFEELRDAAATFDERLTEMMTVQRRLIRVVRQIDPDALDSLGPQTASELVVEMRGLTDELRRQAQSPRPVPVISGQPASAEDRVHRQRMREAAQRADLAQALPQLLADRPVDADLLRDHLHGRHVSHFREFADAIDQLARDEQLEEPPLAGVRVVELLCEFNSVGPQRADRVLEAAELPPEVTMGALGPGDVDRLATQLRLFRHGFNRDVDVEPRPDPARGQDPKTATYADAGEEVAEAFIGAFGPDTPHLEDRLRELCPPDRWHEDGLQAVLTLLEWLRSDVLAAVDPEYVVARPVNSVAAAIDLARHLRPVRARLNSDLLEAMHAGVGDEALEGDLREQAALDAVLNAAQELASAHELEQVDPLRRRQQMTPRARCVQAGRQAAIALLYAALPDETDDELLRKLSSRVQGSRGP